jgi:hypothetical protein
MVETLMGGTSVIPHRLGAEGSLVQIQSPRLSQD